jgi:hypothetical protein
MSSGARIGWWLLTFFGVLVAAALGLQRYETQLLREQIELLDRGRGSVRELQARGRGLAEKVPSEEQLQRLRAERAEVVRLRDEIDRMRTRTDAMDRALAKESFSP